MKPEDDLKTRAKKNAKKSLNKTELEGSEPEGYRPDIIVKPKKSKKNLLDS